MRRFLFLMLLAAGFAACSDEEETLGGKDIQFAEGTSDKIEVYADETEGTAEGGISFTTTGPWRATVTPVTKAGGADWLSVGTKAEGETSWVAVVPDHGDEAGAYSIRIELGVNATGADRSATVTITCGATTITITVTQKGTTESGEVPEEGTDPEVPVTTYPHLVSKIERVYTPSRLDSGSEVVFDSYEFTYDGQNRIAGYTFNSYWYGSDGLEADDTETLTGTLDYSTAGEVRVTETGYRAGNYTLKLNGEGCVESVGNYAFEYNDEGRVSKLSWNGGRAWRDYAYADGVLESVTYHAGDTVDTFSLFDFGQDANDQLSVDVNFLLTMGTYDYYGRYDTSVQEDGYSDVDLDTVPFMGNLDKWGFLRLTGKGSDRYLSRGGDYRDHFYLNAMAGRPGVAKEPGTTYTETGTYIALGANPDTDRVLNYTIDAEGRITAITYTEMWAKYDYTYYYKVLDIPLYEEDGIVYYATEMYDSEAKVIDRADATYIFRFEY